MSIEVSSLPFFMDVAVGGRPNGMHLARFYSSESEGDVNVNEHTNNNSELTKSSKEDYHQDYMHENEKEKGNSMNGKQENGSPQGSWRMEILEDGTITYSVDPPLASSTPPSSASNVGIEPKDVTSILHGTSPIDKTLEQSASVDRAALTSLHSTNAIEKGVCSHYEQSGSFGQDAYAVYVVPNSPVQCLAVADGVGGWRDNNIDSGILSRALMRECVKKAPEFTKTPDAPLELMKSIYHTVKSSGEIDAGSTTACIITLTGVAPPLDPRLGDLTADQMLIDDLLNSQSSSPSSPSTHNSPQSTSEIEHMHQNDSTSVNPTASISPSINQNIRILSAEHSNVSSMQDDISRQSTNLHFNTTATPSSTSPSSLYLHCANLGDSGYFLIRNSRVVSRSVFQRDGRIVKQLAVIPPRYMGHSYCDDPPEDSSLTHCEVQDGDILVVASDGLWDNLIPPAPLFFHYIFGLMSHDGSLVNWNEQLKDKIESLAAECQWEVEREQSDYHIGSAPIDDNPFVTHNFTTASKGTSYSVTSKRNITLVRRLCDRLIQEASSFMNTMHGKPDDLTVLVAQISKVTTCRC